MALHKFGMKVGEHRGSFAGTIDDEEFAAVTIASWLVGVAC